MSTIWRFIYRNRWRFRYFTKFLILLLIIYLIINRDNTSKNIIQLNNENNLQSLINRIRDIPILNQKYEFNITSQIIVDDTPKWIYQYKISHLFNFYWLQTGGYKWHLQQMIDLKHIPTNRQTYFYNRTDTFDYLYHHPEYGVIIDTAPDPFQAIFPPLPRTSSSLDEVCIQLENV